MSELYWFLTDFVINFSNLLGLTYLEGNGLIFGVLFPAYFLIMICIGLGRRWSNRRAFNKERARRIAREKAELNRPPHVQSPEQITAYYQSKRSAEKLKESAERVVSLDNLPTENCDYCGVQLSLRYSLRTNLRVWSCGKRKCGSQNVKVLQEGIPGEETICSFEQGDVEWLLQTYQNLIYRRRKVVGLETGAPAFIFPVRTESVQHLKELMPIKLLYLLKAPVADEYGNPTVLAPLKIDADFSAALAVSDGKYLGWVSEFDGTEWRVGKQLHEVFKSVPWPTISL